MSARVSRSNRIAQPSTPPVNMPSVKKLALGKGVRYSAEASALFARMSVQPSGARKKLYDNLIVGLKVAGVWTKLDALYLIAAHDAQAARLNIIADRYNIAATGSPVFTTDRGYQMDGSTTHLNTSFNPTVAAGPNFTQDSAHLGVYSLTNVSAAALDIGSRQNTTSQQSVIGLRVTDLFTVRLNLNTTALDAENLSSIGHFVGTRTDATALAAYKNGLSIGTSSTASATLYNGNFFIGAINQGGTATARTTRRYAAAHFGGGLTAQNAADLYTIIDTYLTVIGANL